MYMILTIIWGVLIAVFILVVLFFISLGFKLLVWFNFRECKHCKHIMRYKGFRDDENGGYYIFHCKQCGAWEHIPKKEFFHNCNKDCNSNEL